MAAGCIPIVGFNMGAEKFRRVNKLFTMLLISEAAVGAVALILVEFFPQQLISLFGAANESAFYTEFAVKAFRIYLCMMIPACVNKACFIFLQALGKALSSTVLSMLREVVFGVGFAILLPIWFGLDGVLYSMPGFRHFDVCGFGGANSWDISGAKQQSAIKEEILSGRSLERINYI